jgi:hypothetical protein
MARRRTDNTMVRRRTDNAMAGRRTDNTMARRRTDNGLQNTTQKTKDWGVNSSAPEGYTFPAPLVARVGKFISYLFHQQVWQVVFIFIP